MRWDLDAFGGFMEIYQIFVNWYFCLGESLRKSRKKPRQLVSSVSDEKETVTSSNLGDPEVKITWIYYRYYRTDLSLWDIFLSVLFSKVQV